MALPNLIRFGALCAVLCGCSSQSLEAVGTLTCLRAPQQPGCGGGNPSTGGVNSGGVNSGGVNSGGVNSGGVNSGGVNSAGAASGGAASGGAASGGVAGSDVSAGAPGAGESGGSLIHRYTFDGMGAVAQDVVGDADGSVVNAALDGAGSVSVADLGGSHDADQFVDLPNQLISSLNSVTLEVWVTWTGNSSWQRIFDFGDDTSGVDGNRSTYPGSTYLFLTPQTAADQGSVLRVAYAAVPDRVVEIRLDATRALPNDVKTHVAVVIDADLAQMRLYMNGELENSRAFPAGYLAKINDVNNWLGRSNFFYDPGFAGTFHEFRVYSAALNAAQLRASFSLGSDATVPGL